MADEPMETTGLDSTELETNGFNADTLDTNTLDNNTLDNNTLDNNTLDNNTPADGFGNDTTFTAPAVAPGPVMAAEDEPAPPPPPPKRNPVSVGRSLEITTTPEICMEHLVEKLKLLDYEKEFCRRKKPWKKALARTYFAIPVAPAHQSEQFFYFVSLAAWLLQSAGVEFTYPKEFDEPISVCTNVVAALKKLGFATPAYQPSLLRQGHGKEVVGLLDALADYVLEARAFTFRRPVYPPDGYQEEAEGDDDADLQAPEMEAMPADDGTEEEAYMDVRTGPETVAPVSEDKAILESKVDPTQWKLEVERVAPKLRITLPSDARDWRSHLDAAHQHKEQIGTTWPPGKAHLERLKNELSGSLDKLQSREKFLNEQFEQVMRGYRVVRDNLLALQETYNKRTEGVSERNNEMHRIQEQLEDVKRIMDERGSSMTNTSPVMRIKQATKKLQEELKEMEVRIGVVSHTLLSVSLKDKHRLASIMSEENFDM